MKNWEEVDRHSRNTLGNWSEEPSQLVRKRIKKRMIWFNFWRSGIIANLRYIILFAIILAGSIFTALFISGNKLKNESHVKVISERNITGTSIDQNNIPDLNKIKKEPHQNVAMQNQTKTAETNHNVNMANHSSKLTENVLNDTKEKDLSVNTESYAAVSKTTLSKPTASQDDKSKTAGKSTNSLSTIANDQSKQTDASANSENILFNALSMMPIQLHFPFIDCCNKSLVLLEPIVSKSPQSKSKIDYYFGVSPAIVNLNNTTENVKTKRAFPSGSITLGLDYNFKNMFLETGLQYSHFQWKESGEQLLYNPQSFVTQTYAGQLQVIDSISFWHATFVVDSIIHFIDSIWETSYDTTATDIYIPVTSNKYDTLKGSHSWKANISMIEIPLLVGYRFAIARTELSLKAGILFGIITESGGYTYSKASPAGLLRISDAYSTKKFQCSYIIAASISRFLTENWSLEFTPYMRSSLNGLKAKAEGIPSRKYTAWGLGVGLIYKF